MNQSIQKKIGVGIAVIILIMTAIGSLFAYSYAFNNQYSQRQKLDERALDQYVNEVQTTFRDVQMLSQNIAASQEYHQPAGVCQQCGAPPRRPGILDL